jgi:hypothetical protein
MYPEDVAARASKARRVSRCIDEQTLSAKPGEIAPAAA